MSAKKEVKQTDPKVYFDENTDSGILTGELTSGEVLSCELDSGVVEWDKEASESESGVTQLTKHLSRVKIEKNETPARSHPSLTRFFERDQDGDTQLHIASIHGCEKAVSALIRLCPKKSMLDVPNEFGQTALHLAVYTGNAIVTRMLVIAGLSIGARDYEGENPIHLATRSNNQECLKALLAPIPEQTARKPTAELNQRNYNGQACVHIAASQGSVETLQTLVYYGADINATENLAGWSPLHIAAHRGDGRMVQYLRERCANVHIRARDYSGRTPRRYARYNKAEKYFNTKHDSDSETDSDDDMYDSDNESLFEKLRENVNLINVA